MKQPKKLFVIRKFVMATSIDEAIRLDKKTRPQEIWIDDDWKKNNAEIMTDKQIGFKQPQPNS